MDRTPRTGRPTWADTGKAFGTNNGVKAIDPENLSESEFLYRITSDDEDEIMPPPESHMVLSSIKVPAQEMILSGAEYKDHWAFSLPQKPGGSGSDNARRVNNPIDSFIIGHLAKAGLAQSVEADRRTLIRRVTYDPTGLPRHPPM